METQKLIMIETLLNCKSYFPQTSFFYGFLFLLKFIGIIILSNNFNRFGQLTVSKFSISKTARQLTYFGDLDQTEVSLIDYNLACFLIYFVVIALYLMLILVYKLKEKHKFENINKKIFVPISSILLLFVVFFSQHLIEILSLPYFIIIANGNENINPIILTNLIDKFVPNLAMDPNIFCGINTVFIVLINVVLFYFFKIGSNPTISAKRNFKYTQSNTFTIILLICFNLQGVHLINLIFNDNQNINLTILFVTLSLSFLLMLISFNKFVYNDFINAFMFALILFCFYGSLISLIFLINDETELTTPLRVLKMIIQIILACITVHGLKLLKSRAFIKRIISNIFTKNKQINNEYIFELVRLLSECSDDIKHFTSFFQVIDEHKTKCKKEDCGCDLFVQSKYYEHFKMRLRYIELKGSLKMREFEKNFNELITITENEIVNFVYNLSKNKILNSSKVGGYVLLHCDFIFHFRNKHLHSLYLIQQYLRKLKNISFENYFHLIEYKKYVVQKLGRKEQKRQCSKKYVNFMSYFNQMEDITTCLENNCDNFINIIKYQAVCSDAQHNSATKLSEGTEENNVQKIEMLFKECTGLNKAYDEMCFKLKQFFTDEPLKHPELSYLLTNFFIYTRKTIPLELEGLFLNVDSYDYVSRFDSCFIEMRFDQPMIIGLNAENTNSDEDFRVKYVSQKLCDQLGYAKSDLKEKNFNALLPNIFTQQHVLHMKRFILIEGNFKLEKDTFILSKDNYYTKIKLNCESLPSLSSEVYIICDISLHETSNKEQKTFAFILDSEANVLTMTRNFVDRYHFTPDMLGKLNTNFCGLFNININQFNDYFRDSIDAIKQIDLDSTNHLVSVFSHSELSEALRTHELTTRYSIKETQFHKEQKYVRPKEKLLPTLMKIKKTIEELEYDSDWLRKISELEIMFSGMNIKGTVRGNNNQTNTFYLNVKIKNIGNIPFYHVKLYDKQDIANEPIKNNNIRSTDIARLLDSNVEIRLHTSTMNILAYKKNINLYQETKTKTHNSANYPILNDVSVATSTMMNDSAAGQLIRKYDARLDDIHREYKYYQNKNGRSNDPDETSDAFTSDKLFRSLLYFFIISLSMLFMYNFIFKTELVLHSKDLFLINSYSIMLKGLVYQISIFMSTACLRVDEVEQWTVDKVNVPLPYFKKEMEEISMRMFRVYTDFTKVVTKNLKVDGVQAMYDILFEKDTYKILNPDWTLTTKPSNLDSEFHSMQFNEAQFSRSDQSYQICRATNFINYVTFKKDYSTYAVPEEILFYFVSSNMLSIMGKKFQRMIVSSNNIFKLNMDQQALQLVYYDGSMLVVALILIIIVWKVIHLYRDKIYLLLLSFLAKQDKSDLEKNLKSLKSLVSNFDRIKCEQFEGVEYKKATNMTTLKESKIDMKESRIGGLDKGSPALGRKRKTEDHIKTMKRTTTNDEKANPRDNENKTNKFLRIRVIRFSIFVLLSAFLGYAAILASNIYFSFSEFDRLYFSSRVSINFIDKIPKISETILYFRTSVSLNNPYILQVNQSDYASLQYSNTFNLSYPFETDSRFQFLGNSKYAHLFYELSLNQMNILNFMSNEKYKDTLPLTRKEELVLNADKFCDRLSVMMSDKADPSETNTLCLYLGNGVNSQGINQGITHLTNAKFSVYFDFAKAGKDANIADLLKNEAYVRLKTNLLRFYDPINRFYFDSVSADMEYEYNYLKSIQFTFALTGLLFHFVFIVLVLFIIIHKISDFYLSFSRAMKRFKTAMT